MGMDGNQTYGGERDVVHTDVASQCRISETYIILQTNVTSIKSKFKKAATVKNCVQQGRYTKSIVFSVLAVND